MLILSLIIGQFTLILKCITQYWYKLQTIVFLINGCTFAWGRQSTITHIHDKTSSCYWLLINNLNCIYVIMLVIPRIKIHYHKDLFFVWCYFL